MNEVIIMTQEITATVIAVSTGDEATLAEAVAELNKRYHVTYSEATEQENGNMEFYFEFENRAVWYCKAHRSNDWLDPDVCSYIDGWAEPDDVSCDVMDALAGWEDIHFTCTGADDNAYNEAMEAIECGY